MKPRRVRPEDFKARDPSTPKLPAKEASKKLLSGLNTNHIRMLMHSAVMWCDHEGGTVLDKGSHPFASHLEMEIIHDVKENKKFIDKIRKMSGIHGGKVNLEKETYEDVASNIGFRYMDFKTKGKFEARFRYMTSPYSNGNLSVHVWSEGKLVLSAYDTPGPTYQYPSNTPSVTAYESGAWEQFLLNKNYRQTKR